MDHPLLILDLDETLVFARRDLAAGDYDFRATSYYVSRRPHLDEFLSAAFDWFSVAVWTSSGEEYAREVVAEVFPDSSRLAFSWSSARCTRRYDAETRTHYWLKDLRKVRRAGFSLHRVLMIDDTRRKLERHYGNHLLVRPFLGHADDRELLDLLPFLDWIRHRPDFRKIEKRTWWKFGGGG